ncbi:MAG: response regulator [Aureliella sp.]
MNAPSKSVLIVDDDRDICSNLNDILTDLGYVTEVAHDGESALNYVAEQPFDIALLDYKMPGMNGTDLYKELKRLQPELLAIMITAHAGSGGVQEALEAGTWRVLRKPVDVSQLLPLIESGSKQPLVLLVDDDVDFCDSLWQVLRDSDYRVCIAHSEEEGLKRIQQRNFDIALVDFRLGQGDGCNLIQSIVEKDSEVRACLITGHRDETPQCSLHDQVEVFFKPLDVSQVLEVIATPEI